MIDIDVTTLREDFASIWELNKIVAIREISSETEAGNYDYDDETSIITTSLIEINVQGISTDYYTRKLAGIVTAGSVYKAYIKYNTIIENDDRIYYGGVKFVVKNYNKSYKDGQVAFQEFDLVVEERNA
jgi:hypothetical protein